MHQLLFPIACLIAAGLFLPPPAASSDQPAIETTDTAAPDCGQPIYKSNGEPWTCTFSDDFDGTTLDPAKWNVLTTATQGGTKVECRVDSPNNVAVLDGTLVLTARREVSLLTCVSATGDYLTRYTAGAVTTANKFFQTYGRFAIRARMPTHDGVGFHSAIWMYPQAPPAYGPWPRSGEMDINEYRTEYYGRPTPTLHWFHDGRHRSKTTYDCHVEQPDEYHSYVLEWNDKRIRFLYDGDLCMIRRFTPDSPLANEPFDRPFFLILNQSPAPRRRAGRGVDRGRSQRTRRGHSAQCADGGRSGPRLELTATLHAFRGEPALLRRTLSRGTEVGRELGSTDE